MRLKRTNRVLRPLYGTSPLGDVTDCFRVLIILGAILFFCAACASEPDTPGNPSFGSVEFAESLYSSSRMVGKAAEQPESLAGSNLDSIGSFVVCYFLGGPNWPNSREFAQHIAQQIAQQVHNRDSNFFWTDGTQGWGTPTRRECFFGKSVMELGQKRHWDTDFSRSGLKVRHWSDVTTLVFVFVTSWEARYSIIGRGSGALIPNHLFEVWVFERQTEKLIAYRKFGYELADRYSANEAPDVFSTLSNELISWIESAMPQQ